MAEQDTSPAAAGPGAAQRFAPGSPRVLVAGATGFAGALAAHLLWRHPRFELTAVTGRSEVGRALADLYPRYRVPLTIEELDLDRHGAGLDAAVVAYPHAAAAPTVGALRERGARVVDLSADFRLADLGDLRALVRRAPPPRPARRRRLRAHRAAPRAHRRAPRSSPTPAATRPPPCSASRRSRAPG